MSKNLFKHERNSKNYANKFSSITKTVCSFYFTKLILNMGILCYYWYCKVYRRTLKPEL